MVTEIKQVITAFKCIYSGEVSLFFTIVSEEVNESQPFSNSHFHFLITVESLPSQLLLHRPNRYIHWLRSHQSFAGLRVRLFSNCNMVLVTWQ
jgi:hypothetical protein